MKYLKGNRVTAVDETGGHFYAIESRHDGRLVATRHDLSHVGAGAFDHLTEIEPSDDQKSAVADCMRDHAVSEAASKARRAYLESPQGEPVIRSLWGAD